SAAASTVPWTGTALVYHCPRCDRAAHSLGRAKGAVRNAAGSGDRRPHRRTARGSSLVLLSRYKPVCFERICSSNQGSGTASSGRGPYVSGGGRIQSRVGSASPHRLRKYRTDLLFGDFVL